MKHYSSGMYLRLAFAVAAHLEPEILIVDEVLAVGDAAFQRKCLGKMGQVATEGRTSSSSATTCRRSRRSVGAPFFSTAAGSRSSVLPARSFRLISSPTPPSSKSSRRCSRIRPTRRATTRSVVRAVRVVPEGASENGEIGIETPLRVEIDYWNLQAGATVLLVLDVYTLDGTAVFESLSVDDPTWQGRPLPAGLYRSVCLIPGDFLNQGSYRLRVVFIDEFGTANVFDYPSAAVFTVHDLSERRISWYGRFLGVVRPRLRWSTTALRSDERTRLE